jgi:rubrerythrin
VIEGAQPPGQRFDEFDEFVPFHAAGERVSGAFRCAECGYGVSISRELPICPMCAGESWEPELLSSYARAGARRSQLI